MNKIKIEIVFYIIRKIILLPFTILKGLFTGISDFTREFIGNIREDINRYKRARERDKRFNERQRRLEKGKETYNNRKKLIKSKAGYAKEIVPKNSNNRIISSVLQGPRNLENIVLRSWRILGSFLKVSKEEVILFGFKMVRALRLTNKGLDRTHNKALRDLKKNVFTKEFTQFRQLSWTRKKDKPLAMLNKAVEEINKMKNNGKYPGVDFEKLIGHFLREKKWVDILDELRDREGKFNSENTRSLLFRTYKSNEMTKALVEKCNLEINPECSHPLHLINAGKEFIEYLQHKGLDLNQVRDREGNNILHKMAELHVKGDSEYDFYSKFEFMIDQGVDYLHDNENGENPWTTAIKHHRPDLAELIKKKGIEEISKRFPKMPIIEELKSTNSKDKATKSGLYPPITHNTKELEEKKKIEESQSAYIKYYESTISRAHALINHSTKEFEEKIEKLKNTENRQYYKLTEPDLYPPIAHDTKKLEETGESIKIKSHMPVDIQTERKKPRGYPKSIM